MVVIKFHNPFSYTYTMFLPVCFNYFTILSYIYLVTSYCTLHICASQPLNYSLSIMMWGGSSCVLYVLEAIYMYNVCAARCFSYQLHLVWYLMSCDESKMRMIRLANHTQSAQQIWYLYCSHKKFLSNFSFSFIKCSCDLLLKLNVHVNPLLRLQIQGNQPTFGVKSLTQPTCTCAVH